MVSEINSQRLEAQHVIDALSDLIAERFKAEVTAPGDD